MSPQASRRLDFLFLGVWALVFAVVAAHHVPWRDEYQAFLVATRTHSVAEFFEGVRYERHPPLHYLLLRGLSAFAGAVEALRLVPGPHDPLWARLLSWTFAAANACLFVLAFRMPRWFRWGVPLGILFLLDYGVMARCYSIGAFFLLTSTLAAHRGRLRLSWTLLVVAGALHLYFTMMAASLLALSLWDERARWKSHVVPLALAFAAIALEVFVQRPPPNSYFASTMTPSSFSLKSTFGILAYGLTGSDGFGRAWDWKLNGYATGRMWMLGLALLCVGLAGMPLRRWLFVIAGPLMVMTMTYPPGLRHAGVMYVAALVVLLLQSPVAPPPKTFALFVAFMTFNSARFLADWRPLAHPPRYDFSGAQELVDRIGPQLKAPGAKLLVDLDYIYFGPMALLDIDVFDVRRDRLLPYPYFKRSELRLTAAEWCSAHASELEAARREGRPLYFGARAGSTLPKECGEGTVVFATTRQNITEESYAVWRLAGAPTQVATPTP